MSIRMKRCIRDIVIFAVLVFIDRITKQLAVEKLMDTESVPLIRNVLELRYLPNGNTGAAFGMLSGHRWLFLIIAFIVVAVIAYLVYNIPDSGKYTAIEILLVFIAAGGAGNMIDRAAQGYVIDFIYISCINFPIFNVADMYVSVCTVILALIVLLGIKDKDYEELEDAFTAPFRKHKEKK